MSTSSSLKSPLAIKEDNIRNLAENIAKAIVSDKLVLFIGAGLPSSLGLQDWKGLVSELYNQARSKVKFSDEQKKEIDDLIGLHYYSQALDRIAEYSKHILGKGAFRTTTKSIMSNIPEDAHQIKFKSKAYTYLSELYNLGAKKIVTTNYDKSIETCLGNRVTPSNPNNFRNKKKNIIGGDEYYLKLHGGVDEDDINMVLFEEDYRDKYVLDDLIPDLLTEIFTHNCILFLGCGLSDRYMDIYEKLNANHAVKQSYVVCKYDDHQFVAERNGIEPILLDDYSEFAGVLESILVETKKEKIKRCKEDLFSDLPLENYDYDSAREFFKYGMNPKVTSCFYFNTQVQFSSWFSPALQMHLSQQMEAYHQHFKVKKDKFMHYRILFLPFDKDELFCKLSTPSILQDVKAMSKIHQFMSCRLAFITTDVLATIIRDNQGFFTNAGQLRFLGLEDISKMDPDDLNSDDLNRLILKQIDNGYRKRNDLDFAVIREGRGSMIWQANYGPGPSNRRFAYSEMLGLKRKAYEDFSDIMIKYVTDHFDALSNPTYDENGSVSQLSDIIS